MCARWPLALWVCSPWLSPRRLLQIKRNIGTEKIAIATTTAAATIGTTDMIAATGIITIITTIAAVATAIITTGTIGIATTTTTARAISTRRPTIPRTTLRTACLPAAA